jgi:hypothetical protein
VIIQVSLRDTGPFLRRLPGVGNAGYSRWSLRDRRFSLQTLQMQPKHGPRYATDETWGTLGVLRGREWLLMFSLLAARGCGSNFGWVSLSRGRCWRVQLVGNLVEIVHYQSHDQNVVDRHHVPLQRDVSIPYGLTLLIRSFTRPPNNLMKSLTAPFS